MLISELKEEFQRYMSASGDYYSEDEPMTERKLLKLWLDCAEPRERRIKELEEENKELEKNIQKILSIVDSGVVLALTKGK